MTHPRPPRHRHIVDPRWMQAFGIPTAALYAAGFVTFTIDDGARSLYLILAAPVLLIGALIFVALPASLLAGGVRTPGLFRLGVVLLALAAAGAWLVQWATGRPSNLVMRDVMYGATAGALVLAIVDARLRSRRPAAAPFSFWRHEPPS